MLSQKTSKKPNGRRQFYPTTYRKKNRRGNRGDGLPNTAWGPTPFVGQSGFGGGVNVGAAIRSTPLFPPKYRCMLRYQTKFNLTSTTGAVATNVFSANGLYDPDITGTGHQPAGFDNMMLSYEHYTVTRSRCSAIFQASTTNVYPTVAVSLRAGATPGTNAEQNIEDGNIAFDRIHPVNVGRSMCEVHMNADIAQFCGLHDLLDNDDYRGTISANPAEQAYFHVQTWSLDLTSSTQIIEVILEFEAWFTEPRNLTQSLRKSIHQALLAEEKAGATGRR